jgi:hypothetical protein
MCLQISQASSLEIARAKIIQLHLADGALEPQDVPDAGRIGDRRQYAKHAGGLFADDGFIAGVH